MAMVAVSLFSTAGLVSCGGENDNAENAFSEAERGGGDGGVKGNGNNGNGSEGNGDDSNKGTHETVDLGLPSGIRWATCNVGASAPHETGCYFAWGETAPKATYDWDTYKWCKGSENTLTKYCNNFSYGSNGFADNKVFLDAEDDATIANWGGGYRMPTYGEFMELSEKCTWTWETSNGVRGYTVTGTNGNSIFLPAAGYRYGSSFYGYGSGGCLWSATLGSGYARSAYYLYFGCGFRSVCRNYGRYFGFPVRPVAEP